MNHSRNPEIAYRQGLMDGAAQRRNEDTMLGINFAVNLLLQAFHNANIKDDGSVFLYKPKFREFYLALEEAYKKTVNSYLNERDDLSIEDAVLMMAYKNKELRKSYGLPKIAYSEGEEDGNSGKA